MKRASKKKTTRRRAPRYEDLIDPAPVREVRETRRRIFEEAGGTIEGLIRRVYGEVKPAPAPKRRKKSA